MTTRLENKEQFRAEVNKLLRKYKKILLLPKDWKIIAHIHAEKKEYAVVNYDYKKRDFIIHVNHKFNLSQKDLKDTIIHELCHIFVSPYTSYVAEVLDKIKHKKPISMSRIKEVFENKEERIVRNLTKIIQNLEIRKD